MRINFPRRHTIDWIRYKFTRNPPSTYRSAAGRVYLPVRFDHSTLIKVSSIRSAGWGNRSITRTSALSTLPSADRPSPNPKNPLRLYVRPSTKHPAHPTFLLDRAKYPRKSIVLVWGRSLYWQHPLYRPVSNTEGDGTRTSRYPSACGANSLLSVYSYEPTEETWWEIQGVPGWSIRTSSTRSCHQACNAPTNGEIIFENITL